MRRRPARLSTRLLASYVLVVAVGAAATIATVRLLVPRLFDDQVHQPVGTPGHGQGGGAMRDAVVSALNRSLAIAAGIAAVLAGAVAWFVARRIVRPVDEVRATTRALAGGDYRQRVEAPAAPELAALAHDVNALADALERTEDRRQALVTELAHEMRTPITTVAGFLEGFLDGIIEPTPAAFDDLLGEVRRLERLTADLGLLSRLDEGTLELHRVDLDLGEVAVAVANRLRVQFEAAEVALVAAGRPARVLGDADRLAQIVTNLLANALRYGASRVELSWGSDAGTAWCAVADDGAGLDPREADTIFERFHRGSAAAGRPGSGVGLTIARSLARAHGGELTVHSEGRGRGARFELRLPAV